MIRHDLKAGELGPGQRIIEGDLAERYKVSRTPVREALFQLSRDGLIMSAPDRGYAVVVDSQLATVHRHEVRDLVDPQVARHAALAGTAAQRKALAKAHERQKAACEADQEAAFVEANVVFRNCLRAMCDNALLAQCSALVDDQAQWARRSAFSRPDYRALEVEYDEPVMTAIVAGDAAAAEAAMHDYVAAVRTHLVPMPADLATIDEEQPAPA